VDDGGFSQVFTISYTSDGGRDVTLTTVVPEPGSATLLVSAVTLLSLGRRRRA
jgi:hypothetical protein